MAGLIGPDGVGKSTLLALLSGVRKIQKGDVRALDGSMGDKSHRQSCYARIAHMPQGLGRNLYPTLSVFPRRSRRRLSRCCPRKRNGDTRK